MHRSREESYPRFLSEVMESNYRHPTAAVCPNVMITTGMIAAEAMNLITGIAEVQSLNKIISIRLHTFEKNTVIEWGRNEADCPTCGRGTGEHRIFQVLGQYDTGIPEFVRRG
ncbi:hypothetical protein LOK74_10355 [Brevibacillus humidisoli]|uniref:hypothetical protein n=1 Tax=Brevibacillus humidisoli TaxID=2895522 RepID=UPI001E52F856|nr:hypothetical protein [Brevibacillus humidisoli]UFJ42859.1 hypothetical protein LOK74_10355 [Brevibacillus humidisoli]